MTGSCQEGTERPRLPFARRPRRLHRVPGARRRHCVCARVCACVSASLTSRVSTRVTSATLRMGTGPPQTSLATLRGQPALPATVADPRQPPLCPHPCKIILNSNSRRWPVGVHFLRLLLCACLYLASLHISYLAFSARHPISSLHSAAWSTAVSR